MECGGPLWESCWMEKMVKTGVQHVMVGAGN